MAVSKRLRFEILNRDGFRCRYCGVTADDEQLRVDHVIPVTLGGSDDPTNLVASCEPCNTGKASSHPDAPIVANVAEDAVRWAMAIREAGRLRMIELDADAERISQFDKVWNGWWTGGDRRIPVPRPNDWPNSVRAMIAAGLDVEYLTYAVDIAMRRSPQVLTENLWRYFCGVAWRELDKRQTMAIELASDNPETEPIAPIETTPWAGVIIRLVPIVRYLIEDGRAVAPEIGDLVRALLWGEYEYLDAREQGATCADACQHWLNTVEQIALDGWQVPDGT